MLYQGLLTIFHLTSDYEDKIHEDMIPLQYVKWDAFSMVIWSQFRLRQYRDVAHRDDPAPDQINQFRWFTGHG